MANNFTIFLIFATQNGSLPIFDVINEPRCHIFHIITIEMKKPAFAATLLLLAASVATVSCSGDKTTQSAPQAAAAAGAATSAATINIRYIDGDSIAAHYNLAKDYQEVQIRAFGKLDNAQQTRGAEIQRFAAQIEEKARNNGYLTETSYNADMTKLNRMQQDAQNALAAMQRSTEQELAQMQQAINDSIDSFIKDYNKSHGYDAILYRAAGVYFNPSLDITNEMVEGLNARYNKISDKK